MVDPLAGAMNVASSDWGHSTSRPWRKMNYWALALYPLGSLWLVLLLGLPSSPWPLAQPTASQNYWIWFGTLWGLGYFVFAGLVVMLKNLVHAGMYRALRDLWNEEEANKPSR